MSSVIDISASHNQASVAAVKVAAAASAAGAAAEAAKAAAALLAEFQPTPHKRTRRTTSTSSQKHSQKVISVQRSDSTVELDCKHKLEFEAQKDHTEQKDNTSLDSSCAQDTDQRTVVAPTSVQCSDSHRPTSKMQYAKRGTARTFQGKRQAKDTKNRKKVLKAKAKAAFEKAKMEMSRQQPA